MRRSPTHLKLVNHPAGPESGGRPASTDREVSRLGQLEDAELVHLARQSVPSAFEWLYRRHAGFALNLAARVQGNSRDIEDIVHDAFVCAHQRLCELKELSRFRSWLGSIVVRLVRTRLRRARLFGSFGIRSGEPLEIDAIASSDASPEARAQLAQLYALLNTLAVDERIAWTLRYVERHRLETVAELSGCSLATAKRRIGRAERFLDEHFITPFPEAPAHV